MVRRNSPGTWKLKTRIHVVKYNNIKKKKIAKKFSIWYILLMKGLVPMEQILKTYINKSTITNTINITLAAILAIIVASLFDLEFAVSAGIVAILSVAQTKKETIKTAISRFVAFVFAIIISYICFEIFGYTKEAFFVYLLVFIFVCQCFNWNNAMAMDSVLISHFLTFGIMDMYTIKNEGLLFVVGVFFGILVNLHLHKDSNYMEKMKNETDEQIRQALHRMGQRILDSKLSGYDGKCFEKMNKSVRLAKNVAEDNYMNQLISKDRWDIDYIAMREQQINLLNVMYKRVKNINTKPVTAHVISDFLEKMSQDFHQNNSGQELLQQFKKIDASMKEIPLPVKREEFEDRAQLYILLRNIEEFLMIKIHFSKLVS